MCEFLQKIFSTTVGMEWSKRRFSHFTVLNMLYLNQGCVFELKMYFKFQFIPFDFEFSRKRDAELQF